jgi:NAD(P)-dependent dehydrogenase (short-subunit alcohol dehydrogenase family)
VQGSIVLTGSNGGLGSAIVDQLINQPDLAKDLFGLHTVRNLQSAENVSKVLKKAESMQHMHELVSLDLGSLDSVRTAAEDINERVASGYLPPIRALILNAGWQEQTSQTFTSDGFDMSFQANYLAHFLLTLLLLQSMDKERGRIVILGSWTHE